MRTYFLAPETGTYVFSIACDDECKLKLSTDERPVNLKTLVYITRWTRYKDWRRSHSATVVLSKDRSYFLEAIMIQGRGDYHMTVGVQIPTGSVSGPVSSTFLVKYAPPGMYGAAPMGDWGAWSQCSKTCGLGTQARNRSCINPPPVYHTPNTTYTEMRICVPIKPCSVPRRSIQVRNTSSTSLLVEWKSEWQDRWPHELRQFQIIYNRTAKETAQYIIVNASNNSVELRGLVRFTRYCVRVVFVTLAGMGQKSPCVFAKTEQDVPCSTPERLAADSYFSPFKISVTWTALSNPCWQGVPRGYSIRLQVKNTVHEENKTWSGEFSVGPLSTDALLEGLQTYTTYSLQVAALTDMGPGPYSEAIHAETCRCPRKIFVSWMEVRPLCFNDPANGTIPAGLLPELLDDMILYVCGTCHEHKRTEIIFKEDNSNVQDSSSTLSEHIQLNLPIRMEPKVPFVGEGWAFLPVVEVAGFAFLTRKPSTDAYARQLGSSVLYCWPAFVMLFVMYFAFGLTVWTVERNVSPAQFSPSFARSWKEGVWFSFVSMSTAGYGDHVPTSVPGRLLTIACLLVGVVMDALFVATLTSSLTASVLHLSANSEQGKKIGVINGSVEHRWGMRVNGSKGTSYHPRDSLLYGLNSRELDGALIDVLTLDSLIKDLDDSEYEVSKTVPNTFYYGIGLTGEARHFLKDFEEYLTKISIENRLQQSKVYEDGPSTETTPTVSGEVEVIEFFDPTNYLYQRTVKVTGVALVVLTTSGLIYFVIRQTRWLKTRKDQSSHARLNPAVIKAEMRKILDEFHFRIHQTYGALKIKHRRELLEHKLRCKRTCGVLVVQIHHKKLFLEEQV
ncbi:hypothetical protein OS493_037078 [Desmophyllum pertusum]|uniref:Uncharacterized protein n=1 Tax=Desmophyllum pertusum TaxID=174260 RepID=A0A9W9Z8R4_9CNID|nr:hypothetical protein OS493_037078 [Desmophyllum pertusum]